MADDAISLLKQDHKALKKLLQELEETSTRATKSRRELLERIGDEIRAHAKIEEEIFYPAFKNAGGKEHEKMNYEAKEEHRAVEELVLPDLERTAPDTNQFSGRAKVLKELIEHHADEEEEEMFPKAEKSIPQETLKVLGEEMKKRKAELQKQA